MTDKRRLIVVWMALHLLVPFIVGAASFASTLPLEPEMFLKPLGSCFEVTLPEGGLEIGEPFRLVAVEKLTCGETVSRTSSPGTAETLVVPVGYNNGSVTVAATPTPSGEWPAICPFWSGDILSSDGDTATVDTSTSGLKSVTASCGNSVSLKVQVIGVGGLQVRRKGSGQAFGDRAVIAAGGKSSDVHKAELEILLDPVPAKQTTLTFPVSLSGASAHTGTNVHGVFTCGTTTITGDSSGAIAATVEAGMGVITNAVFRSCNVTRTCTVTIGEESVDVEMEWDISGCKDFDYDGFFFPDVESEVFFYPTLDEIATEDEDEDGNEGEGAIGGHHLECAVTRIKYDYWSYDYVLGDYIEEGGVVEMDIEAGDDPEICFEVNVYDLFEMDDVQETPFGKYVNTHIVSDYYEDDGEVISCIVILEYEIEWIDTDVHTDIEVGVIGGEDD